MFLTGIPPDVRRGFESSGPRTLLLPPPRWRTEREWKAKIVESIERAEKVLQREHGGGHGPRRRM